MIRGGQLLRAVLGIALLASGTLVACTPQADPSAPTGLTTTLTESGFDVAWNPVAGAASYELRYSDLGVPDAPQVAVTTSLPSASLTDLTNGHRYRVAVRGISAGKPQAWSPPVYPAFVIPVLPVVRVTTDNRAPIVSKEVYLSGEFSLDAGDGSPPIVTPMEVKGRGNTTWTRVKKPYRLKLSTKTSLLGMPKSKHWVLLADDLDPTHLRNPTAFALGAATGLGWTPRTRQVELILNGAYNGVYELVEKIDVASDRVAIDEMDPDDVAGDEVTGGYLAEIDSNPPDPDEYSFRTSKGIPVNLKEPEDAAPEQKAYITGYVSDLERALYSTPLGNYRDLLDVPTMIDYYLVNELTRNQDAFLRSTYFTKPRLGKITMGPLWDFDNSLGNTHGWDTGSPTGWFVRRSDLAWIGRLFEDPTFEAEVAARWDALKPAFVQVADQVESQGAAISVAMVGERVLWPPQVIEVDTAQELATWLHARIDWIDANIDLPTPSVDLPTPPEAYAPSE